MALENVVKNNRNQWLNVLKGIGCMGVVFIHILFPGKTGEIVSKLCQFAVPVFFMIAGYYAVGCSENVIKRRLLKILKIFLYGYFWFFVYNIIFQLKEGTLAAWLTANYTYRKMIKYVVFCTIDFAMPLWYLIAMMETYLFWFLIVKYKKEEKILKIMHLVFGIQAILTTICVTNNYPWSRQVNFIASALPWFLFGYYSNSVGKKKVEQIRGPILLITTIIGGVMAIIPLVFEVNFICSCVGIILYATSLFVIAIKHPDKTGFKPIAYIGDKLSLNIYIFHVLIDGLIKIIFKVVFKVNIYGTLFLWLNPLITLAITVAFSFVLEKVKCIVFSIRKSNLGTG